MSEPMERIVNRWPAIRRALLTVSFDNADVVEAVADRHTVSVLSDLEDDLRQVVERIEEAESDE